MTNEKANNMLDDISWSYGGESITTDDIVECRKICHDALEKQIPKKLICIEIEQCCPICKEGICFIGDDGNYGNHCLNCGQALDWSDAK